VLILPGAYEDVAWYWIWVPWGVALIGGVVLGRFLWDRHQRGNHAVIGEGIGIGALSAGSLMLILRTMVPSLAVAVLAALGGVFGACFLFVGWKVLSRR
jgi:hypothetical protein